MTVFPDQAADDYDERIQKLVPGYRLALDLFGCALVGRIDPQGTILVPGCGTGSEILALAHIFPGIRFTAVEPSSAMLEKARHRICEAGLGSRVEFLQGFIADAPNLHYAAATVSLVLHFLPDDGTKAAFLSNIAQRLPPDARLLMLDPPATHDDPMLRRWLEVQGHSTGAADAICHRMATEWHRVTPKRLDDLLYRSGFTTAQTFFRVPGYAGLIAERRRDD